MGDALGGVAGLDEAQQIGAGRQPVDGVPPAGIGLCPTPIQPVLSDDLPRRDAHAAYRSRRAPNLARDMRRPQPARDIGRAHVRLRCQKEKHGGPVIQKRAS